MFATSYQVGWTDYKFQDIPGQKFRQYHIQNAKNVVVNLSKWNLHDSKISLLSKGLNFVPTCSNVDTAKLKMELEALGRMLPLKYYYCNEKKNIHRDMFELNSKFNLVKRMQL